MPRTDKFRHQHDELLKLAGELKALLQPAELARDAAPARACLSRLIGKLSLHLAAEDKVLYPELSAAPDAAVADLARRFAREMEGTARVVTTYNQKWATPSAIKADPAGFVAATQGILQALADRIRREDQQLYAAADRIEGRAFA